MPVRNEAPAASTAPAEPLHLEVPLVAIGSAEFNEAVARAVAAAMAQVQPVVPREVAVQAPAIIPQTSIDTSKAGPDDLTVQFNRFCVFQNCGYQRGQQAGFPRAAAEALARFGSAVIVHDPRRRAA